MRIDLGSSDSFFLPDRPLTAKQEEDGSSPFGDILKQCAEEPAEAEGEESPPAFREAGQIEVKLYLALDARALEFVEPRAVALTAEELAALVAEAEGQEPAPKPHSSTAEAAAGDMATPAAEMPAASLAEAAAAEPAAPPPEQDAPAAAPATRSELTAQPPPAKPAPTAPDAGPGHPQPPPDSAAADADPAPDNESPGGKTRHPLAHDEAATPLPPGANAPPLPDIVPLAAAPPPPAQSFEQDDPATGGQGSRGEAHSEEQQDQEAETEAVRELSYEEIQRLMTATLNSGRVLPPRVQELIHQLLSSLGAGHRWPLNQHRLIGLEHSEWELLTQLFPRHFYAGLLRVRQPLYTLLQDLSNLQAPDAERQNALAGMWAESFGAPPALLTAWLADRPLDEAGCGQLPHLLERWQQLDALPPGSLGRILQLALAYRHHPERMESLFEISRHLLHGRQLHPDQRGLLARCIGERCFAHELSDSRRIETLLGQVLAGQEPEEPDLRLLLTGCAQGVLSYLPPTQLAVSLQALQDYARRDLLGREELIPELY